VQLLPDPPISQESEDYDEAHGAIAQLGERLVCNQKVTGSIPVGSTNFELLTTCIQEFCARPGDACAL
jgi:hypothetical protein